MAGNDYFGEEDIIQNQKRTFSVICEKDGELFIIPRREFEVRILDNNYSKKAIF